MRYIAIKGEFYMVCTFFGHKDAPDSIKNELKSAINHLVNLYGVRMFYVGNNGSFDSLVQRTLIEIQKECPAVSFYVVLSYLGEHAVSAEQEKTILPEGQELALPRYAISKRNGWLINKSNFVIAYVRHRYSNSWKWLEKSRKRGLTVINLAEIS